MFPRSHYKRQSPKYDIGGDLADAASEAIHKVIDWWTGSPIPTKVSNFLKQHGDEPIESLKVVRVPIYKTLDLAVDVMSGGKFGEIKKRLGYDKFFHLFVVINGKHALEKNELFNVKSYTPQKDEESVDVPLTNKGITISDFLKNASEGDEKAFYRDYDAFGANCQQMVIRLLSKNHLLTPTIQSFVKQDVETFVKELKPTAKRAKNITNVASVVNRLLQLVSGGRLSFATGTDSVPINRRKMHYSMGHGIRRNKSFM